MNGKKLNIVFSILCMIIVSCGRESGGQLKMRKIEVDNDYEIDTLETFENDSLLIVNIVKLGALGKSSISLGAIIRFEDQDVAYEAIDFSPFILSNDYVSKQEAEFFGKTSWGWYNVTGDGTFKPLPYQEDYEQEIEKEYPKPKYFVNSNNTGEYFVYEEGTLIRTINYGNMLLKDTDVNFMNVDSKVLEVKDKRLIERNDVNPDEVLVGPKGLFFVSKPGKGVLKKVEKKRIIQALSITRHSKEVPSSIEIK